MNALPHIGRPNRSGLSTKVLGFREYQRQWQARRYVHTTGRRRWTGLSRKQLGSTAYGRLWRALSKTKSTAVNTHLL